MGRRVFWVKELGGFGMEPKQEVDRVDEVWGYGRWVVLA